MNCAELIIYKYFHNDKLNINAEFFITVLKHEPKT
ncbi:hypothetical protein SASC598O11_001410 [Snodgrassella alvi SCGC AB-598-O11]|nr:hypothetical protein SASC598O11_001410 [Snodgrassella alvi SCGC AB-598-O11]